MKRQSSLEFALLGLLQQQAQSGYDLRKTFATTAMRHFSDSPGSIYPALRRLEERRWITAESPALPVDPRRRRVFRLTAAGRETLVARISLPVTRQDVIWQLPELMLRFAFMDGNVPRATAIRFLTDFERELGGYVEELRGQWEQMGSLVSIHTGVLAFQSGIEGFEAQLEWARRSRALLAEEPR
jgi:DNA-binding PadR family transcriptional regulator